MKTYKIHEMKVVYLLFLMAFLWCSSCEKFGDTVTFKEANQLFNDDKYDQAIEKYKQLTDSPYFQKEAWLHIGYCHLAMVRSALDDTELQTNATKAIEAFKEYLKLNPGDTKVEDYIFNTYMDSRDYDNVLRFLFDKFEQDNRDVRAMQLIIQTYEDLGKVPEAVEWYKKRLEIDPNDPNAYYAFAVFYWRNSYYNQKLDVALRAQFVDEGIELCKKAVELNPEFADAYTYWNLLLREKVKYTKNKREQERLLEEAKTLQEKGTEMRLAQQAAEEQAKGGEPGAEGEQPARDNQTSETVPTEEQSPADGDNTPA